MKIVEGGNCSRNEVEDVEKVADLRRV